MLSLPNDGRYLTLELAPQQRRQKTLEALTAQLEALSRSSPVLMIFEDAHRIDPTSLEAIGRTVERLRTLGVLLIVTYRPEFEPPWIGRPYVTALTLNRLGDWEIAAMIDKPLPPSIRLDIIERTDGIPLFVEEMTKAVLEAESQGDATATVPPSALAVPASLHASLMARLDRLGCFVEALVGGDLIVALGVRVARRVEAVREEAQKPSTRTIEAEVIPGLPCRLRREGACHTSSAFSPSTQTLPSASPKRRPSFRTRRRSALPSQAYVPTAMRAFWRLQRALARLTKPRRVVLRCRVHLIPSRLNAANLHRQFVCLR